MSQKQQWILMTKRNDFYGIGQACGISPYLVRILCNRGIDTLEKVQAFLGGTLQDLYDPYLLKDMDRAVKMVMDAARCGKKIRIIGDYDVDGVTSAYILKKSVELLGAQSSAVIPHRIEDGYGLNRQLVETAIADGVDMILTCDNGISAYDEIALAKEAGLCVVVTDHHEVPYEEQEDGTRKEILPPADAIVNPKRQECQYPFKGICGALVAYKLSMALLGEGAKQGIISEQTKTDSLSEFLEFAALGTVCDVMELLDENRIVVKYGLLQMSHSRNLGLRSLIQACGIEGKITYYHVGFVIGPCLNATGRLDTARRAVELFEQQNENLAQTTAEHLKQLNDARKQMTQEGIDQAIACIEAGDMDQDTVLVVYLPDCHESLAGIVAGRIREQYNKPTFIVTDAREGLKGSGRSIEEYHMRDGLQKVSDLLTHFGGHKLAAGFSLERENLEEFRRRLNVDSTLTELDLTKKVYIDIDLPISYADMAFVRSLETLEPFGTGNRSPLFAQRQMLFADVRVVGQQRRTVRFKLVTPEHVSAAGIYFGDADAFVEELREHDYKADIIYSPKINVFRGESSVQLEVKHYRFPDRA